MTATARLPAGALGRPLDAATPAAGAVVMGTTIVSTGLALDGEETLSRVLLVIATAIWLALAALVPLRAARDRAGFLRDVRTPGALTAPIATAVLGARVTALGWTWAGIAALAVSLVLWAALQRPVVSHLKRPTIGVSLLVAVSAEALAVLAIAIAVSDHARWLLVAAIVPFVLGLGLYAAILSRFDVHQLVVGGGDHWITGGALGIATLAAARLASGSTVLGVLGGAQDALQDVAMALWVLTMLWLVVLVIVEVRWPRLRYDLRRWSTVFPIGMFAVCSFAVGTATDTAAVTDFARVWVWVGLAAWAVVFAATARHARA